MQWFYNFKAQTGCDRISQSWPDVKYLVVSWIQMYDVTDLSWPPVINASNLGVVVLKPSSNLIQNLSHVFAPREEVEKEATAIEVDFQIKIFIGDWSM